MEEMESSQKSIILFYQQIQKKKKNETTFLLSGSHSPTVFESRIGERVWQNEGKIHLSTVKCHSIFGHWTLSSKLFTEKFISTANTAEK